MWTLFNIFSDPQNPPQTDLQMDIKMIDFGSILVPFLNRFWYQFSMNVHTILCSCYANLLLCLCYSLAMLMPCSLCSCYALATRVTPSEPSEARRVRHYDDIKYVRCLVQCSSYVHDIIMPCVCYVHAMRMQIWYNTHSMLMPCVPSLLLNTFANGFQVYYLKRASRSDARTGSLFFVTYIVMWTLFGPFLEL